MLTCPDCGGWSVVQTWLEPCETCGHTGKIGDGASGDDDCDLKPHDEQIAEQH